MFGSGLQYGYDFLDYENVLQSGDAEPIYMGSDQVVHTRLHATKHCNVVVKIRGTSSLRPLSLPILARKETAVLCHEALPCEI
jgi:hypothetical protein